MKKGWKHPGRRSSDYGKSKDHDHDRRVFEAENIRDIVVYLMLLRKFKVR